MKILAVKTNKFDMACVKMCSSIEVINFWAALLLSTAGPYINQLRSKL